MRLFKWVSLALAGTGLSYGVSRKRSTGRRYMAAQTRAPTYASMATGINGAFTECTLDTLQVICTCDTEAPKVEEWFNAPKDFHATKCSKLTGR